MKNTYHHKKRDHKGRFTKTANIIAILLTLGALGSAVCLGLKQEPAIQAVQAHALTEGCDRTPNGLACDFTSKDTIENLRRYVPMYSVPEEVTSTSTDTVTMEKLIRRLAWEEGLDEKTTQHAIDIATCESGLNPFATNGRGNSPSGSVDRSLWMYNSYWQKSVTDKCAFDPECSTRHALKLIKAGKAHLWVCHSIVSKKK